MNHLLILACSQAKTTTPGLVPAIDRYDGTFYRVLHTWLARGGRISDESLTLLIISGRYGLISHNVPILNYNQRMTPQFARQLRPALEAALPRLRPRGQVLIAAGKDYRPALPDPLPWPATFTTGGIGQQMAQLKAWLDGTVGLSQMPASPRKPRRVIAKEAA